MKLFIRILRSIVILINKLIKYTNTYASSIDIKNVKLFELIEITHNSEANRHTITFYNGYDLRNQDFFTSLWASLIRLDVWNNMPRKIIMVALINPISSEKFYVTRNFVITQHTTLDEYWNEVKKSVQNFWDIGSIEDTSDYTIVSVEIWEPKTKILTNKIKSFHLNKIQHRSYSTKSFGNKPKWCINPLDNGGVHSSAKICTLDVETFNSDKGVQLPFAISFAYKKNNTTQCISSVIDAELLYIDRQAAILKLWTDFYGLLKSLGIGTNLVIYTHNLGAFDGYFILPSLFAITKREKNISVMVDDRNKFISIKYKYMVYPNLNDEEQMVQQGFGSEDEALKPQIFKWNFIDSYRVFPSSLENLCKMYNVPGKFTKYKPEWNNISLLQNETQLKLFLEYSKQDSICLLEALLKAQQIYLSEYEINITKAVSTPSLSLLIFRKKFLNHSIPILKRELDNKIRPAYFGGSSDYYYFYGENLKYYDINSLYPFAMLNQMPLEYLGEFDGTTMKLEDCFGFVEVIVTAPKDIETPLLLHNMDGKIIHPTGTWKATYFSEELKEAAKYGYSYEIIKVYQFTKAKDLFKDFIDHFYELKKTATQNKDLTRKNISKLHLNTLYGMFGRKLDSLSCIPCSPSDELDIISKYPVKSVVKVTPNLNILLVHSNVDFNLIKKANSDLHINLLQQPRQYVKSNVAIAAAITAYARIEMMKFKNIPGIKIYYTDTDSIIINKELPSQFVGDEIGQMKDELDGGLIKKAYFFGIKKYAFIDHKDQVKTVFSGLVRNSLSWDEVEKIGEGVTLTKEIPGQFFKSLSKLEISIKHKKINVKFDNNKQLVNNKFQHIQINDVEQTRFERLARIFISKIKQFLSRFKKS